MRFFTAHWGSKNMFSFFRPKNLTDFMLPISYLLKTKNWSLTPKIASTPQINIRGNLKISILVQNGLVIFNLTIAHTEEKKLALAKLSPQVKLWKIVHDSDNFA